MIISEIQVYPAAFPSEYESELNSVVQQVAIAGVKRNQVQGEYQFDGSRYQCKISLTESAAEKLKAHQDSHPELYY